MSRAPCYGTHDGCRPWGWRLLASLAESGARAHYFEKVIDETALDVYASQSSICGLAELGDAGEHWRAHPHAGTVALCTVCCRRLSEP